MNRASPAQQPARRYIMSLSEAELRARVAALEAENRLLKTRVIGYQKGDTGGKRPRTDDIVSGCSEHSLSNHQIKRYSRQLLLPSFGVQAQERLSKASVLVVGAGGLGCPSSLYLAAAGVGHLTIVDHDSVEVSNLHRQISHTEAATGESKALSAAVACMAINSSIQVDAWPTGFKPHNALELVQRHSVVIDASDNSPTRYLLSDACAISKTPLVSGAAIGFDAQLTVYCHGSQGPCYRCIFPEAPMPRACASCSDAGVLGPVPGVIGVLQALEAIKIVTQVGTPLSQTLLLFDGMASSFRSVKIRPKRPTCAACGQQPTITADSLPAYDYTAFTGSTGQQLNGHDQVRVVDVRPVEQFRMAHLPGSVNVPFLADDSSSFPGFVKQRAVALLHEAGVTEAVDIHGGLQAWAALDTSFPSY
ncbi:hypothetical protein WJX73_000576 [Symbiochloris irregularis]|uniref:Rhodanese domain-containing protein n=1 Tax=Symbiochloris irregularis TaxID=706552 RepID=A0AAW1NNS8_9CHLO